MSSRSGRFVVVLREMETLFQATWELQGGNPPPNSRRRVEALFEDEKTAILWAEMEAEKLGMAIHEIRRVKPRRRR